MRGSVRARLTLAVTFVVGAIALTTALVAPKVVRASLIDDRLDAQRDVEATGVDRWWYAVETSRLGTPELTALYGPDVAALTAPLDEIGALAPLRAADPDGDLRVLTGRDIVATVTPEGLVRVERSPAGPGAAPVVARGRLERLAADYGVGEPFDLSFPLLFDQGATFDALFEEFATKFSIDLGDVLDPSVFDGFPRSESGAPIIPPGVIDLLHRELPKLDPPVTPPAAVDPPTTLAVGTRTIDGRPHLLTASLDGVDASIHRVRTLLWLGLPITVVAAAMLTWLLAGRSLRPVAAITERTRRIRSSTLHERVPVPQSHDEIAALANEMNAMLDRMQRDDERRRRFVSDASHELRSPIASIRAQAEAALADVAQRDLAEGVLAEADRMGSLVDDLLSLARHDEQLAPPGRPIDLDDLVYAEAARPRRVPVDVSAVSAGQVRGRADELSRVVTHLIDNAARHASTVVTVSLSPAADGSVRLTVDDDGDGIEPADRERIFERFVRLDDARSRDSGGAGLGLAVADVVVRSMGGSIVATDAPAGGARFEITFPPAEPA